jgi:PAS domain S-box-containing protein
MTRSRALPALGVAPVPAEERPMILKGEAMPGQPQKTILLVEDEAITAMAEKSALEKYGYTVILAHSGEEAVTTLKEEPDIELILMDINLGKGIDGTEAAEIILRQRDIPVVFLSSHMEPDVVEKTEKITSYGYVVKDSSITVLDASIKMAFKLFAAKINEKKKESLLSKSEEKFRLLFTQMPSAVAIYEAVDDGNDFVFKDFNMIAEKVEKIKKEEIIGKRVTQVFPGVKDFGILAVFQRVWKTGRPEVFPSAIYRDERDPGTWRENWVYKLASGEVVAIYNDITERKRAEEALHIAEARFRLLFEQSPDGIVIIDPATARILEFNETAHRQLGYSREEFARLSIPDLEALETPEETQSRIARVVHEGLNDFDTRQRTRQGEIRDVHVTAHFTELQGRPIYHCIWRDITDLKRAETALHESEERYRSILNASPDGISITDMEGRILMVSPAVLAIAGCEREEEMLGRLFSDFIVPDDRDRASSNVGFMRQGSMTGLGEYHGLLADGSTVDLEVNGGFIRGADGQPAQMVFVLRDIRKRKQVEKFADALYMISQASYSTDNLNELFGHIHHALSGIIPTENLFIALLSDDGKRLIFPFSIDEKDTGVTPIIEADNSLSLTVEVLQSKKPLLLDERELRDRYATGRNKVWGSEPKCWLGVPLISKETVIGVMAVQDYHKSGAYGQKDVTLLESAAGQVAIAIERKRAEEALRASEAKQSNALQMTKAGHWEYDVDRDVFTFNDNFYRIFRTTAAAVGGYQMSPEDYARRFCHPDDMAVVGSENRAALETADPNYSRQIEHRILYADGEVGWIAVRFFIVKDPQGRTVQTYGVNQDISERKWAEGEIKRQLAEKEILLQEVHHRIKNNIASIAGLISLQMQAVRNPQAIAVLQDAIGRLDSMRILYDKLLLSADYKDVPVKNYVESLVDTVVALFPDQAQVRLDKRIADFNLSAKQLFPLGIILNELLTNAMKYAFSDRKTGLLKIFLTHADNHVTLTIQDNGAGLPAGFDIDKSKGFGLTLVKMLSQQLKGTFSIETRKGTRCAVEFDI